MTDDSSGVNLETLAVSIDGESESNVNTSAITGGYRATISPTLEDGLHTVEISVQDQDENIGVLSLIYTVDTIPPKLAVWDHRLVIDDPTVLIQGTTQDSAGASVAVSAGSWIENTGPAADGTWMAFVPLEIGTNTITVTATDGAGLTTSWSGTVVRMITDRSQTDLDKLRSILNDLASGAESTEDWADINNPTQRGGYNYTDLNRVGAAAKLLTESLNGQGYNVVTSPKTNWAELDTPTESTMGVYLKNVETIFKARLVQEQDVILPDSISGLMLAGANNIEWALVCVDAVTPVVRKSYVYSGEAFAGEF